MSLAEQIAKKKAEERLAAARRADPDLEAKLDKFIRENPRMREQLTAMSTDELIRRLMSAKMGRAETVLRRNGQLEQWVTENPDIVAKVEQRIKNLAGENRQRTTVKIAEEETLKQNVRAPGMRP